MTPTQASEEQSTPRSRRGQKDVAWADAVSHRQEPAVPARQRTLAWNPQLVASGVPLRSQVLLRTRSHSGVEYSAPDWRVSGVEGIEHRLAHTGAHKQRGPPATAR